MMKEYDSLTPEAQRTMDAWRESMEGQAKELANDFQNVLRTKMKGGKIDGKFGNPEYLDRMMGTFAKEMSESLKESYKGTKKKKQEKEIDKVPQN